MNRKEGYYWIQLKGEWEPLIGYTKGANKDIIYPWYLTGDPEPFTEREIERVLYAVQKPPCSLVEDKRTSSL